MAAGATLLAAGKTWQIVQHYRWPVWLFWLLVTVMLAAAVLNTAVQMTSNAPTRHGLLQRLVLFYRHSCCSTDTSTASALR